MSNVIATCNIIAKEALPILENMCGFARYVGRDWEDEYKDNMSRGYAPGATINIKKPPRYMYRTGRVAAPQATVEPTIPLVLSQGGCDLQFTSFEKTLTVQRLEDKIVAAVATVANEIDRQGLAMARQNVFNTLGTPGTVPNTQALALAAITGMNQRMDEMAAPRDKRRALVLNPGMNAAAIQGLAGLFNGQSKLSEQYSGGMMVDSLGLSIAMDQNVDIHTNGTAVVNTNTVNGAGQTGSVITVAALNGTITKGTKVSFGVNAVNPQSRTSTGSVAQFVVTADVVAGATSLPISPALTPSGAFQNVVASPANGAIVTIFGTAGGSFNANVGFHRDAFTLAMVPMWAPPGGKGVIDVSQQSRKGFTVKVTEFYDGVNDNAVTRLDVLFGWASPYPELACLYAT
jgi:hypothetical protein